MITSEEAREKTKKFIATIHQQIYTQVETEIHSACEAGKDNVRVPYDVANDFVLDQIITELENLGYYTDTETLGQLYISWLK